MKTKSKVQSAKVQSPKAGGQRSRFKVQGSRFRFKVQHPSARRPAAVDYLSRFLCVGFALALLATGCAGPRPLKGGRAVTTHKPAGVIEQTLVQGENPSQATKQDPGERQGADLHRARRLASRAIPDVGGRASPRAQTSQEQPRKSGLARTLALTLSPQLQLSTLNHLHPERSHAGGRARGNPRPTELGAAQKDTARELGAKLSSLKGIVWVGVGLFVFGLASLVWPPLKVVIASVTTSAALMLGGVALMVLPSLVVGNELLILGGVGVAVGGWFLAHRHGQLRGMVAASTGAQSKAPPVQYRPASTAAPKPQGPSDSRITHHASRFTHHSP